MIKKVLRIENLGCLRRLSWGGSAGEVGRLVGVYAENGAGKTTLVAALRAAARGIDEPLQERRSLPARGHPSVDLLTSAGRLTFSNGAWRGPAPVVEVFDRSFVADNVYDGREVGPDQREQLYRIALGAGEVEAARTVNDAKKKLAEAEKLRKEIEKRLVERCAEKGFTLEELKRLEPLEGPPPDVANSEARLVALEARRDLQNLPSIVPLPAIPNLNGDALRKMLDQTATSLSEEAITAVRDHIANRLDTQGEAWLRKGVEYSKTSHECPFCGQDMTASTLIGLLPRFFDDSYNRLRSQITQYVEKLRTWADWVSQLRSVERANQKALAAWTTLITLDAPPDVDGLPDQAEEVFSILRSLMTEKQSRLLDAMGTDLRIVDLIEGHRLLSAPTSRYNDWANMASQRCRRLVVDHQGEVRRLQTAVRTSQGRILRGQPFIVADLEALESATDECTALVAARKAAEENLKQREGERTSTFLDRVNTVLEDFGTGYRLRNLEGKSSSSRIIADFQIALVDGPLELDGSRVRASTSRKKVEPRFDTVLSDGDRTTLALAVFFARCLDNPDPSRVAVLDDPLTSLDRSRRTMTGHCIRQLAESCAQVWLLSHDEFFLRDSLPRDASFLSIRRNPNASSLEAWDAQDACRSSYARNVERLEFFRDSDPGAPTPEDAWRLVRPVLEEYLRFRFRRAWRPNEWLLDFVRRGRAGDEFIPLPKDQIEKIATLCRFSNPGMHGDPQDACPPPSATEVRAIVAGVLAFLQS